MKETSVATVRIGKRKCAYRREQASVVFAVTLADTFVAQISITTFRLSSPRACCVLYQTAARTVLQARVKFERRPADRKCVLLVSWVGATVVDLIRDHADPVNATSPASEVYSRVLHGQIWHIWTRWSRIWQFVPAESQGRMLESAFRTARNI